MVRKGLLVLMGTCPPLASPNPGSEIQKVLHDLASPSLPSSPTPSPLTHFLLSPAGFLFLGTLGLPAHCSLCLVTPSPHSLLIPMPPVWKGLLPALGIVTTFLFFNHIFFFLQNTTS